jgi:hypothetical protein
LNGIPEVADQPAIPQVSSTQNPDRPLADLQAQLDHLFSLSRRMWRLGHLIEALVGIRKLADQGHAHVIDR